MQVSLPWTCMWQRSNEHIDVFLHAPPRKSAVGALSVYRFPLSKLLKVAVVIFGLPPGVAFFPDGNAWEQDISTSETENGDSLQVHCTLSWQILGYNGTGHQQAQSLHRTHLQFICELSSVTSPTNCLTDAEDIAAAGATSTRHTTSNTPGATTPREIQLPQACSRIDNDWIQDLVETL